MLTRRPADRSARCCARSTARSPRCAGAGRRRPSYDGTAEHLQELWVAVRAAVRSVLDEVTLDDVVRGRLPAHVRRLITAPDAWQPR